jgi:lysophospholipase L1-like esterase
MPKIPVDTVIEVVVGPLIDDTDYKTLETGVAYNAAGMSVDLVKKGVNSGSKTDLTLSNTDDADHNYWSELGNGYYLVRVTVAQNDAEGTLLVNGVATGILPFSSVEYEVVPVKVYDALVAGSDNLETDLIEWRGVAPLALSSQQVQAVVPATQKVDVDTIKTQTVHCGGPVHLRKFVGQFFGGDQDQHASLLNLSRNSDRVQVCPYDTISTATANWGRTTAGTRDMITVGKKYQFRQTCTIESAQVRIGVVPANFYLKIYRKIGSNYWLVGRTPDLADQLSAATCTVRFPPMEVREGDYYGYMVVTTGNSSYQLTARTGQAGVSTFYTNAEIGAENISTAAPMEEGSGVVCPITFFARAPQIVGIGDSIMCGKNAHGSYVQTSETDDDPDSSITAKVGQRLKCSYQNMGIGSETSALVAARIAADCVNLYPRIAIVEVGVNDIATSVSQSTYVANMTTILNACQAAGIIPVVCLIAPWTNGTNTQLQTRDAFNAAVVTLCGSYSTAIVVDLDDYLGVFRAGGDAGNLWDIITAYNGDGVHFTTLGYSRYADAILDAIAAAGLLSPVQAAVDASATGTKIASGTVSADLVKVNGAGFTLESGVTLADNATNQGIIADNSGGTTDASEFTGAFPAGAFSNIPKTGYTMTGTSGGVGPSAGVATADIYGQVFKNATRPLYARVYLEDGTDAQQADITSIAYTIYLLDAKDKDARTAVVGHTAVALTVASVIFDSLQSDQAASNYNMRHTPDVSTTQAFTVAGDAYLVEYTITPTSGQVITVRHRLNCI